MAGPVPATPLRVDSLFRRGVARVADPRRAPHL